MLTKKQPREIITHIVILSPTEIRSIHTWLIHLNLKLVYYWTCLRFLNEMMYCSKTSQSNTKIQILEQTQIHATCPVDGWSGWWDVPRIFLMLFFILENPACSIYNSFVSPQTKVLEPRTNHVGYFVQSRSYNRRGAVYLVTTYPPTLVMSLNDLFPMKAKQKVDFLNPSEFWQTLCNYHLFWNSPSNDNFFLLFFLGSRIPLERVDHTKNRRARKCNVAISWQIGSSLALCMQPLADL